MNSRLNLNYKSKTMNKFDAALKKYLEIFANQEMYFTNDLRNLDLFEKKPLNKDVEDIRTKVSAVNDTDLRHLDAEDPMIAHILKLDIDDRLNRGDLTVVEDIAQLTLKGQPQNLLHFASVYCNYHKPYTFPIYSEQFHDFYKKYIIENKLPLDPEKLNTYPVFTQALNHLNQSLGVDKNLNYLHQRKFAWLYAESVLKESN